MKTGEGGVVMRPKTTVKTDPKLMALLRDWSGADADRARDFFLALATCNAIVPIVADGGGDILVEYQGESPDEQALVYAAAAYGHTLVERTSGHVIIDVFGDRQRYALYAPSARCSFIFASQLVCVALLANCLLLGRCDCVLLL
jgi:phospholipid-transporting ATPase